MKRIGLFGGSFDPIHTGHIEVAKQVRKQLALHEVWFLPTVETPLKKHLIASFSQRCQMIQLAIKPYSYFKLHQEESRLPQPSYTINLVTYLQLKYPDVQFYWIIGDDQYEQLDKWYQIEELKQKVQFVVVNRHLTAIEKNPDYKWVRIAPHPASSSAIRGGDFSYLYPTVVQYINDQVLYYSEFIDQYMSEYRYKHVLAMTELAVDLAKRHAANPNLAKLAGLLHDIAKDMPKEEAFLFMKDYFPEYQEEPEAIWHQYIGAYLAKHKFQVRNKQVLKAIYHHTLGTSSGLLSKIIYCADKTDDTRKYDKTYIRVQANENIHKGFILAKERAQQHQKEKESKR